MKTIVILILIFLTLSYSFQGKFSNNDLIIIPLAKQISQLKEIKCSQFIDEFEYIQLETNEKCLIDNTPNVLVLKDFILIYQIKYCFVFDRKSGKFLNEISQYGRGPGEYNSALQAFNYEKSTIYSRGWDNSMMMHSLTGNYLGSFLIPDQRNGLDASPSMIFQFSGMPNSLMVGYSTNMIGSEKKLLSVFNQKGETIEVFPNKNVLPKQNMTLNFSEAHFYHYNNETYFKEWYTDTLFKVTEKELIPNIIFKMDEFTVPYSSKWWSGDKKIKANYIVINKVFANSGYVLLNLYKQTTDYIGLFDKRENKLFVNELKSGMTNDVDNFISFNPTFMDNDGNFIEIVNPKEIVSWFKENPSKLKNLPDKIKRLQTLSEEKNPIIMIGKTRFK
jgi:hypothetical protein